MTRIPAFRAAGIACAASWAQALWPGPLGWRPSEGERKKFCMSIIIRADLEGEMVMGDVLVWRVIWGLEDGVEAWFGWVRSKPVVELCSQKFEWVPIRALRWGVGVSVVLGDMVVIYPEWLGWGMARW